MKPNQDEEYPEYVGHFLLEFFIIKKIPVKNDQCIQRTPWKKGPKWANQKKLEFF